ncbi:response regulator [Ramlibacter tataouinensis]|uniref:Candidate response regulator, CheY n=1 Tax=Ramlibacter tataouinensis (strain ATCC BAA-407 / DSM 14655 / LMG 21543 / TTB310) TaxID=365046 RepID=F5XX78_RAMTT|nr:response regulator [Ramlibacter tataouinensis]AEG93022.1 candidate response regulator, CheY [Ramlibacter tataouinensis TTB310]
MASKILVVDDAPVDRDNLQRILAGAGHTVITAESGEQAIARARSDAPDLIMMDVNMPDMDGFAAARKLKSEDATRNIPVVFVSGKNQKADMAWGLMLGAKGYVAKPYTAAQILAQLA